MESQSQASLLRILKNELPYLREQFGVEQIGLFGSFATGSAGSDSDVDIVVSLSKPLGFAFFHLADYLEEKLGRKVDLVTAKTLDMESSNPRRAHIVQSIRESLIYV